MGLSVAISGGIIMMTIMIIFGVFAVMLFEIQVETSAGSQVFDNNNEILKTSISISGINYTVGSNLVNFTLTNKGSEKLWNYDEFDVLVTYDADILGTKTTRTEKFTYNVDAFALSTSQQRESPIFNVQHGCTTIPSGSFDATLNEGTDYTNPTGEAFVRITNTRLSGNGNTGPGYNNPWAEIEDFTAYVRVVDFPNQIIFTRNDNPAGGEDTRVCYEIIDYVGLSDGKNAIKVLDINTVTYTSGSTTVTGASVTPDDDSDIVVFITGQAGEEDTWIQWGETLSTAEWDAINDQPIFTRGEASGSEDDNDLSYAIVEFSGENWKVQRVEHLYTAAGVTETESISALADITKVFLHTQHRTGSGLNGLDEQGEEAWISALDTISFQLQGGAGNPNTISTVAWIIENTAIKGVVMNVQHISGSQSGGTSEDIFSISIPTNVRSTSESSLMGENARSSGTGTAYPRGAVALELSGVGTVTGYRSDEGQTQTYRFSVVEYPQATACAGGNSDNIAVNEWTINCIKFDYFEPDVVNPNESPEILTKLQYPLFGNGLIKISVSTDKGITAIQTTTVS